MRKFSFVTVLISFLSLSNAHANTLYAKCRGVTDQTHSKVVTAVYAREQHEDAIVGEVQIVVYETRFPIRNYVSHVLSSTKASLVFVSESNGGLKLTVLASGNARLFLGDSKESAKLICSFGH